MATHNDQTVQGLVVNCKVTDWLKFSREDLMFKYNFWPPKALSVSR